MLKIDPSSESLYISNPCNLNDSNQSHETEKNSASAIQCGWSNILDKLHNFSKPKQKKILNYVNGVKVESLQRNYRNGKWNSINHP